MELDQALAWRATAPTMMMAGESLVRSPAMATMSWRTPVTSRCFGVYAHCTIATGVVSGLPLAVSSSTIVSSFRVPIKMMIVSTAATIFHWWMSGEWPESTMNDLLSSLSVIGTPTAAAAANTEEIPGTISHGTPAASIAVISCCTRPNTSGSPPLSRTTQSPAFARFTIRSLISACGVESALPPRFPTILTYPATSSSSSGSASSSAITMSASSRSCLPRTVMRSTPPGPAPTRNTRPWTLEKHTTRAAFARSQPSHPTGKYPAAAMARKRSGRAGGESGASGTGRWWRWWCHINDVRSLPMATPITIIEKVGSRDLTIRPTIPADNAAAPHIMNKNLR
eukprot:m.116580 g.116580  ORF g.116580 m.116580 type:complete len:340 (+) comp21632_c0_seq1:144-1163(+)